MINMIVLDGNSIGEVSVRLVS